MKICARAWMRLTIARDFVNTVQQHLLSIAAAGKCGFTLVGDLMRMSNFFSLSRGR